MKNYVKLCERKIYCLTNEVLFRILMNIIVRFVQYFTEQHSAVQCTAVQHIIEHESVV